MPPIVTRKRRVWVTPLRLVAAGRPLGLAVWTSPTTSATTCGPAAGRSPVGGGTVPGRAPRCRTTARRVGPAGRHQQRVPATPGAGPRQTPLHRNPRFDRPRIRMDAKATAYLHQLAHPAPRSHAEPHAENVSAAIAELIDQFPMPTIVLSRYQDVLAANPIARALSPGFKWDKTSRVGASWILRPNTCTPTGTKPPRWPWAARELSADDPGDPHCSRSSTNYPVAVNDSEHSGNRPTWDTPKGSPTCAIQRRRYIHVPHQT